jgi:hypothetical protein
MHITTCDCCAITVRNQRWIKIGRLGDNNLEEDNLEDGVLVLEQLENALIDDDDDDDDHVEIASPSTTMIPMTMTPTTTVGASFSVPLPSTSTHFPPTSASPPLHGGSHISPGGVKSKE